MVRQLESSAPDPTKPRIMSIQGEEKSAWRLPKKTDAHHLSTDANLFSISLPNLSHEKLNFRESDQEVESRVAGFPNLSKRIIGDDEKHLLGGVKLKEIESHLPGDVDKLFAGVADDFDLSWLPTQLLEDLDDDIFGSGGGLEIENKGQENLVNGVSRLSISDTINGSSIPDHGFANGLRTVNGEHPYGEHPSRTLFVRNINSSVEDSDLKSLFEQYGDIRTLYTACKHRGFVMISYFDIRAARTAMSALQNKPLKGRKLDIHYSIPKDNPSEKEMNQGTLVVFNLDPLVSNDYLCKIFGAYGEIKEITEAPFKTDHKFIEYYDVRAAEAALKSFNKKKSYAKCVKLEPSRPGGAWQSSTLQLNQELEQDKARRQVGSPITISSPGSWPNYSNLAEQNSLRSNNLDHLPGLASILPCHAPGPANIVPIGGHPSQINQAIATDTSTHGMPYHQYFSVPNSNLGSMPPLSLSGPDFLWGSHSTDLEHVNYSALSSPLNWCPLLPGGQQTDFSFPTRHSALFGSRHPHIGSAPSGIQLDRNFGAFLESPDFSYINHVPVGVANFGPNNMNWAVNAGSMSEGAAAFAGSVVENGYPSYQGMPIPRNGTIYAGNGSLGGMGDGAIDFVRGRRVSGGSLINNRRKYELNLEKIINGEDNRTTLMIKNIPNKYTSKLLLAAIDETHRGAYDFLYLPIDFTNRCNVGYAFINLVSPSHVITFYKVFNGKKWESFNSEKVSSLAYARIQGKKALISHFQNSSLMNEDKSCQPIIFQSNRQEHFPSANPNM